MDKAFLFSLSLMLVLLFHSSLAHHHPPEGEQHKCRRVDRIGSYAPSHRVNYEGGFVDVWDFKKDEFECTQVAMMRITIYPNGLVTPVYAVVPMMVFVEQGEGLTSALRPGCPPTYQSAHPRGSDKGSSIPFFELNQKVQPFRPGDLMALPAGMASWWWNNGDKNVVLVRFFDLANSENQLDLYPRLFHLSGNPSADEFRPGSEETEGQQPAYNVLRGFDSRMLSEAFQVDEGLIRKMQRGGKGGGIIKFTGSRHLIVPSTRWDEDETEKRGSDNQLEDTICNVKLMHNIRSGRRADYYTPRVGRLVDINSNDLPMLREVDLSFETVDLYNGAVMIPHWTMNAHKILYILEGSAHSQVTDEKGDKVFDGELKEGHVFIIPQGFVAFAKPNTQKFSWVTMKTSNAAVEAQFAGRNSFFVSTPETILANSYGITPEEARRLKESSMTLSLFAPGSSTTSTGEYLKADA